MLLWHTLCRAGLEGRVGWRITFVICAAGAMVSGCCMLGVRRQLDSEWPESTLSSGGFQWPAGLPVDGFGAGDVA